jgi:putative oxidoreductase
MVDWAILVLRIVLGVMFAAHGFQKVFGLFGGPGISNFSEVLSGLGFRPAILWAYLAAYTELVGGCLVTLGLFTRGAATLLLILIVVAAVKVHLSNGFFLSKGGSEYAFVIAGICIALIIIGGGKFSIYGKF